MQWPIRLQIMIPFCILTFLLLAIVSAVNAYIASRAARQHIVNQLDGIAETLEKSTFPWTASVLRQASGLSGAAFAVTDRTGAVRAATIDVGRQLDVAPRPAALAPLGRSVNVRGTPFFDRQITRLRPGDTADARCSTCFIQNKCGTKHVARRFCHRSISASRPWSSSSAWPA